MRKHKRLLVMVGLLGVLLLAGCQKQPTLPVTEAPDEIIPLQEEISQSTDEFFEDEANAQAEEATDPQNTAVRTTVVYYLDDVGNLVPVTRRVAWTDGIAKATLAMLKGDDYNDMEAAKLGLKTILPASCDIDLNIDSTGNARVDLSKNAFDSEDAAEETGRVRAVVQTLTEFPTVERVEILMGGQKVKTLKYGTSLESAFTRDDINLEGGLDVENAGKIRLFFGNETGKLIVPVTRMVFSNADINTAVLELCKGPKEESGLSPTMPDNCGLIDVKVKSGVATVNFTQEFMDIAEQTDGGKRALKALILTCTQFPGVKDVKILVDGKEYDPGAATIALPTFVNDLDEISQPYDVETIFDPVQDIDDTLDD